MDATVEVALRAEGGSFTVEDAELLRAVADAGSVRGASDELGRSRARALNRIETLEESFGPLVERQRGGATGGGSELTPTAREILARFDRLQVALDGTANAEECVIYGTVAEQDGEFCVVQTGSSEIRARLVNLPTRSLSADGRVQVSVRVDTVTLHAPTDSPAGDATSARNRFEGAVIDIDRDTAMGRVTVDIGTENPLVALLTDESLDRLALTSGDRVVASFKATATRAIPAG